MSPESTVPVIARLAYFQTVTTASVALSEPKSFQQVRLVRSAVCGQRTYQLNGKAALLRYAWRWSAVTTAGCGFSLNEAAIIKLSAIQATGNNLRVTQTMQFKTEAPVIWSVNGIPGGNADIGTISSTGLYTAPAIVPLPNNQVTIGSSAEIYPSKGSYGVSVLNPIPIVTTITPGSFSEGMAQIVVNGSAFVYGAQILWNGVAVPTTYISGTQLVAIITENTPGTYPVTVVNPDPGSASSKSVNALVQPGQVVIQLQPSETSVRVNNTITITPTVTGSQDTALTWTVNGIAGGNAQIGTISAQGRLHGARSGTQSKPGGGASDQRR